MERNCPGRCHHSINLAIEVMVCWYGDRQIHQWDRVWK